MIWRPLPLTGLGASEQFLAAARQEVCDACLQACIELPTSQWSLGEPHALCAGIQNWPSVSACTRSCRPRRSNSLCTAMDEAQLLRPPSSASCSVSRDTMSLRGRGDERSKVVIIRLESDIVTDHHAAAVLKGLLLGTGKVAQTVVVIENRAGTLLLCMQVPVHTCVHANM